MDAGCTSCTAGGASLSCQLAHYSIALEVGTSSETKQRRTACQQSSAARDGPTWRQGRQGGVPVVPMVQVIVPPGRQMLTAARSLPPTGPAGRQAAGVASISCDAVCGLGGLGGLGMCQHRAEAVEGSTGGRPATLASGGGLTPAVVEVNHQLVLPIHEHLLQYSRCTGSRKLPSTAGDTCHQAQAAEPSHQARMLCRHGHGDDQQAGKWHRVRGVRAPTEDQRSPGLSFPTSIESAGHTQHACESVAARRARPGRGVEASSTRRCEQRPGRQQRASMQRGTCGLGIPAVKRQVHVHFVLQATRRGVQGGERVCKRVGTLCGRQGRIPCTDDQDSLQGRCQ